jgi:hypothetical protein
MPTAVKTAPPEAYSYAWQKINSFVHLLQTFKPVVNFRELCSTGDATRLSEQYWNFRTGSTAYTLMMEAAGSNRKFGTLDRRKFVTGVLMKI